MQDKLTKRERIFCEKFFESGKKGESAAEAGYSNGPQAASRLLKKPEILEYVRELQAETCKQLHIDKNWAVLKAMEVYEKCTVAVPVKEWSYEEHKLVDTGEYTFDSKGALKALEIINKLLGLEETGDMSGDKCVLFIDDMGEDDA